MSFNPIAGWVGSVQFGAYNFFSASHWTWKTSITYTPFWSADSQPGCDLLSSKVMPLALTFSGIFYNDMNPFAAVQPVQLGQRSSATFTINGTYASKCDNAIVVGWDISDEADANPQYVCTLAGNWIYPGFNAAVWKYDGTATPSP